MGTSVESNYSRARLVNFDDECDPLVEEELREELPRWKRPHILYSLTCLLITATIAAVTAVGVISIQQNRAQHSTGSGQVADVNTTAPSPTLAPSPPPSKRPVASPPSPPQPAPTKQPTMLPTKRPTNSPTQIPPTLPPPTANNTVPFSFYVMGDTPYRQSEELLLIEQMEDMTETLEPGATFTVHVGDFQRGKRSLCQEQYYANAWASLKRGPLPTFVLAGDNDYLDCPSPEEGWDHYLRYFCSNPFEQSWVGRLPEGVTPLNVTRFHGPGFLVSARQQSTEYSHPEMFAFVEDGILFMSLTLINDPESSDYKSSGWEERLEASTQWASVQAEQVLSSGRIRGVVLFGHALLSNPLIPFFMGIEEIFQAQGYNGPTLYLHGDGHKFKIERGFFSGWPLFTGVQVDQGGKADPILVKILPRNSKEPFVAENSNQYVIGNGLFLIDRRGGRYEDA